METTAAAASVIDVICETLGLSLEQLASDAKVHKESLLKARGGELHPETVHALSEHLRVSKAMFTRATEAFEPFLTAFRVVEPYERIRLVDKIQTIQEAMRRIYGEILLPTNRQFPSLDLLLDEYDRDDEICTVPFVAHVRQRLKDEFILVFSHPLRSEDYSAIFLSPNKRKDACAYLVVDEDPECHPITNGLYQWYDVLRILSRIHDWKPDTNWHAVYLEHATKGYDEKVDEQLMEQLSVWGQIATFEIGSSKTSADPDWYRLPIIVAGLVNGLSPSAVADCIIRSGLFISQADVETVRQELVDRRAVNPVIEYLLERDMVPLPYDWSIPSYPERVKRSVLVAATRSELDPSIALEILGINGYEMFRLHEHVHDLESGDTVPSE